METCDEPHPNTNAHTAGAGSNKGSAQAATRQEDARSRVLHNPAQVCELLPGALLPGRDAARELHRHARGAAGYISSSFGKLSPAVSPVQAVPPRRMRAAAARPRAPARFPTLLSQGSSTSPLPSLAPARHRANLQQHTVCLASAVPGCSPGRPQEGLALVSPTVSLSLEKTSEIIELCQAHHKTLSLSTTCRPFLSTFKDDVSCRAGQITGCACCSLPGFSVSAHWT